LPHSTIEQSYDLEYGTSTLAMHEDAILPGERVLLVDDVLATGGTAQATARLIADLGGQLVGCAFLMELSFLEGRSKFEGTPVFAVISFDEE